MSGNDTGRRTRLLRELGMFGFGLIGGAVLESISPRAHGIALIVGAVLVVSSIVLVDLNLSIGTGGDR